MSNITNLNRDYLIKINVKEATIDVPKMTFWNTDKKTSNMFVQLVINMSENELIKNYVTIENATDYKIVLNVIKPKTNQYRTFEAKLLNEEKALFEIDLTSEFIDQVGNYNFEFEVSSKVDNNDESITTSSSTYEVKGSILTNLNQEISSSPDLPILKQLIEQVKSLQGGDLTGYQKKEDETLETTSKEVVGAINEVNSQYKDIAKKTITTEERAKLNSLEKYDDTTIKNNIQNVQTQVNNLVLGAVGDGNNAEVVQARGGYAVINDRFEATESAIYENKNIEIIKTNGESTLNSNYGIMIYNDYKAPISINQIFLSVTGNGNVYLYKGIKDTKEDGGVGVKDVSLINTYSVSDGENLYDESFEFYSNEALYAYWDSTVSLKYAYTNDVGARPSNNYYWSDSDVIISNGASKYMSATTYSNWVYGITFGGTYKSFIDFSNYHKFNSDIEEVNKSFSQITYRFPTQYELFIKGKNLVNPYDCTYGGAYINKTNGKIANYGDYYTSDFIEVTEGEKYFISTTEYYAFYDKDKSFVDSYLGVINAEQNGPITIPTGKNIKYIRTSFMGKGRDNPISTPKDCELCVLKESNCKNYKGFRKFGVNFNELLLPHLAQPFANKNIVIVGDSYTDQGKYFEWLYTITGANYIGDIGKSGEPLCRFAYNITQNSTLIEQADLVVVIGGTNDYGVQVYDQASNNISLGTLEDIATTRNVETIINDGMKVLSSSIYAGVKEVIDTIAHYNENAPILFITQPERGNFGGITYAPNPNPLGLTMTNIAKAIKDCTSNLGCDCYDFHAVAWRYSQRNKYTADELHPNEVGAERMGKAIGKYINNNY